MAKEAPATPVKEASPGLVDFGGGFLVDFSDLVDKKEEQPLEEEVGNADNVTLEGAELPAKPEPAPEEPEPAKSAEPVKAEPVEPETYEFDIKYRGENLKEKLTKEQIVARLQLSKDYTVKTEELSKQRREVAAIKALGDTPWFKETYEEAMRTGVITNAVVEPPKPDPIDEYEYQKRRSEPEFQDVLTRMREYSLGLPEEAQLILQTNHKVFLREYDRFLDTTRKERSATEEITKVTPAVAKKILQSKEVAKAQAVIEKPGVATPEVDPSIELRKRITAIHRDAKAGKPGAIQQLAYYAMYDKLPEF